MFATSTDILINITYGLVSDITLFLFFFCTGLDSPEDLCTLYSNRAACHLKVGNSQECIQDCSRDGSRRDPVLPVSSRLFIPRRALELQPFYLKPLLRRAMAYDSLERYRNAYADYKTVLQIDSGVQAAHDGVNR
ncbi:Sperm-associated antigen 1A [Liparis tanakae]|uniref:Sperm-associated antigen 1A n=1 Tax=Liparis tanakae TaxID=230148 RepID=A0A4Z2EG40_9TELE|nr:Sperm-associated antigen 1A [Liparis tanakae]